MGNYLRPKDADDEFESLFESFGTAEPKAPAQPAKKRGPGERFSIFKRRRQASQAAQAITEDAPETPAPTFDPAALKAPLDLDAARHEFLLPEDEPPLPESAPAAAQPKTKAQRPAKKQKRARDKKVKPLQLIILGGLLILVIGVYGALALIILRTRPQAAEPPTPAVELLTLTEETLAPTPTPSNTPPPTRPPVSATPTGPPPPLVSTHIDLRLLQDPDNVGLRIERGYKYLELRAYDLAVSDFEYALQLDDRNPRIHVGLGQAHFFARRWERAEAVLGTAIAYTEDDEEAHFWLGVVLYYAGRYDEAAREFDWAAELNPDNPRNEAWLALAAAHSGQLQEAEAAAERALALDARFAPAYLGRAQVRIAQGDFEAAQGDLLYARNLAPYDFETLNALARFYADHVPERLVEAERLVQQAQNWTTWDIQRAQALQTLGRIYLIQGRKQEAKQVLARASDLATVDGRIGLPELVEDFDRAIAP